MCSSQSSARKAGLLQRIDFCDCGGRLGNASSIGLTVRKGMLEFRDLDPSFYPEVGFFLLSMKLQDRFFL